MSPTLKRKLSTTSRTISPPATRRKRSTGPQASHSSTHTNFSSATLNPSHLNIYSWNVNGIGPLLQNPLSFKGPADTPLRAFLRRHKWPAVLCLQEVKIAPRDFATQRSLQVAANTGTKHDRTNPDNPGYTVYFSLPTDKYNATGFGGKVHGVATLVRHDVTTHGLEPAPSDGTVHKATGSTTRSVDWDLEGRVLVTLLPDPCSGRKLAVINGYWVNGTENQYRDPLTGKVNGTRHDHKLWFHEHMLDHCRELEADGYYVILIGDMNIAPQRIDGHPNLRTSPVQHVKNRADFNSKFLGEKGWGVDTFRLVHGNERKYTYHSRRGHWGESCDRVDLIVTGKSLVKTGAIIGCDIEDSMEERGHSDHVPLWVSVDVAQIQLRLGEDREETHE